MEALRQVYYNSRTGYGSARETHQQARRVDPSITLAATRAFLKKQEVNQTKKQPRYNSFVEQGPREQFQVDLADFGKYTPGPRYGLAAVDPFTKKFDIEPMTNKMPRTAAKALDRVVEDMNLPNNLTHDEGKEFTGAFSKKAEYYDIDQHVTRTHPRFVDRAIGTFKEAASKRMRATGEHNWLEDSTDVVGKMNDTVHTATGLKPKEVESKDGKNEAQAKLSMEMRAKKGKRVDPELTVGDNVRRALKTKNIEKDGPNWSSALHRVEAIEDSDMGRKYKIAGYEQPYFRHELQKINGVEYAPSAGPIAERPTMKQVTLMPRLTAQRDRVYRLIGRGMSLLSLSIVGKAIMEGLRKQGVKNWGEFLKLYPGYFRVSRTRVVAVPRQDMPRPSDRGRGSNEPAPNPVAPPAPPPAPAPPPPPAPTRLVRDTGYFKALRQVYGRGP